MIEIIKKYEKTSILVSVCMLILSIFLIFQPMKSVQSLILAFGFVLIVAGIVHVLSYFLTTKEERVLNFSLAQGVLEIITGILICCGSGYLTSMFTVILGIWLILTGIIKFQISLSISTLGGGREWIARLIFAIITVIAGIIIVLNPFATAAAITSIAGIIIAIYSAIDLAEAIYTLVKVK